MITIFAQHVFLFNDISSCLSEQELISVAENGQEHV